MRKVVAVVLASSLVLSLLPTATHAGDRHAVRNRWIGVAIGAGSVLAGGILFKAIRGTALPVAPPPVAAVPSVVIPAPTVVYPAPAPVIYSPPPVVYSPVWMPGHYEDRWVPVSERQQVWVEGHYQNGWWVPGHWEERIRQGGYWTRVWVEGYWR